VGSGTFAIRRDAYQVSHGGSRRPKTNLIQINQAAAT